MTIKKLTEKTLLAMPEEAYMDDTQLDYFRTLLESQRDEIIETIHSTRTQMASVETEADPSDVASNHEALQLGLRTSERLTKHLKNIESALRRITEGEYGFCEISGEPIGLKRLLARPTATLSIQAKEDQEYREKIEGEGTPDQQ